MKCDWAHLAQLEPLGWGLLKETRHKPQPYDGDRLKMKRMGHVTKNSSLKVAK